MVAIKQASPSEIDQIIKLEQRAFNSVDYSPNKALWSQWIKNAYTHCLVDDDGHLIGVAVIAPEDSHTNKVEVVCIDPDFQKNGIGTSFLRGLIDCDDNQGKSFVLDVERTRHSAIGVYKKLGFADQTWSQGGGYDSTNYSYMMRAPN